MAVEGIRGPKGRYSLCRWRKPIGPGVVSCYESAAGHRISARGLTASGSLATTDNAGAIGRKPPDLEVQKMKRPNGPVQVTYRKTNIMQTTHRIVSCLLTLSISLYATSAQAGKFNRVLSIGDAAPAWEKLTGTDGKPHSLSDHKQAKAVVVVFTCNHCPVATAYEERLIELAKDYGKKDVAVVAISVSQLAVDNLEAMQKRADEKKYPFSYLHDASQKSARQYGALCTPHVFLLNEKRQIAYMGAIDDSMYPQRVTEQFLRLAIQATLKNEQPELTETRPVGCPIDYEEP